MAHPDLASRLSNLAQLLQATNRLGEAEPLYHRALAIDEKTLGPEHPNLAAELSNLAQLHADTNRLSEAEPLMRRALAIDAPCVRSVGAGLRIDIAMTSTAPALLIVGVLLLGAP